MVPGCCGANRVTLSLLHVSPQQDAPGEVAEQFPGEGQTKHLLCLQCSCVLGAAGRWARAALQRREDQESAGRNFFCLFLLISKMSRLGARGRRIQEPHAGGVLLEEAGGGMGWGWAWG